MRIIKLLAITVIFLSSFGCESSANFTETPLTPKEGYPASEMSTDKKPTVPSMDLAYPGQKSQQETINLTPTEVFTIPTPSSETAVIIGYLLTPDESGEPYLAELILGDAIQADQVGYPPMISYSDELSLRAEQTFTGQFYFSDVLPGEYALLIATPLSANLILDPKTNTTLIVTAQAGKVTDLGIIVIP